MTYPDGVKSMTGCGGCDDASVAADAAMCRRWFGMNGDLFELTGRTLRWLRSDPVGAAALPRLRDLIVRRGNVPAAAAMCRALRDHAAVFASRAVDDCTVDDCTVNNYTVDNRIVDNCANRRNSNDIAVDSHVDNHRDNGDALWTSVDKSVDNYAKTNNYAETSYADTILAAVMVDCLPEAIAHMRSMGVPDDVIEATLRDFAIWAAVYTAKTGRPGIWELEWNLLSLTGNILRIGRLQYESIAFAEPYYIFRRSGSAASCEMSESYESAPDLVVIAAAGLRVRADGRLQGTNGDGDKAVFTTTLSAEGNTVTGYPVDTRSGTIQNAPITFRLSATCVPSATQVPASASAASKPPLARWDSGHDANATNEPACMSSSIWAKLSYELILAPGMPTTSMHIPAEEPLTPESVNDSIVRADVLLSQIGRSTATGFCESWLLDPALERFSPAGGNICRFMRRFVKFPVRADHPMIIERVFGWGADRLAIGDLPEDTGLQRRLKQYLRDGGEVYDTAGVMLFSTVVNRSER